MAGCRACTDLGRCLKCKVQLIVGTQPETSAPSTGGTPASSNTAASASVGLVAVGDVVAPVSRQYPAYSACPPCTAAARRFSVTSSNAPPGKVFLASTNLAATSGGTISSTRVRIDAGVLSPASSRTHSETGGRAGAVPMRWHASVATGQATRAAFRMSVEIAEAKTIQTYHLDLKTVKRSRNTHVRHACALHFTHRAHPFQPRRRPNLALLPPQHPDRRRLPARAMLASHFATNLPFEKKKDESRNVSQHYIYAVT